MVQQEGLEPLTARCAMKPPSVPLHFFAREEAEEEGDDVEKEEEEEEEGLKEEEREGVACGLPLAGARRRR